MKSISLKWTRLRSFAPALALVLILLSCNKDKDNSPVIEKDFAITGFTKVYAMNGFNITVNKGDNFSIRATGPATYVNDITATLLPGHFLDLQFAHNWNDRPNVDVVITLPLFLQINLAGADKGVVNGFQDEEHVLRAVLSGASRCTFNGAPINVAFDISGGSELDVNGETLNLYGNLSGAARLNAYNLLADEVDIDASGGSQAFVKVVNSLFASASGGSRIHYKGSPAEKHIETSGGGEVIQE